MGFAAQQRCGSAGYSWRHAGTAGFCKQGIRRRRNDFAPSNLRGMKLGLKEFVNVADLGIPYLNSPLSTRRSYIKTQRDVVLRVLRAYYQAVQETRNDRNSALKILAKYVRVDDPEILSEVYRIYGTSHLQKNLTIDLEGVRGLLNGLGSEATQVDPAVF